MSLDYLRSKPVIKPAVRTGTELIASMEFDSFLFRDADDSPNAV